MEEIRNAETTIRQVARITPLDEGIRLSKQNEANVPSEKRRPTSGMFL